MNNWTYHLRKGHSHNPAEGACAMDAINWLVHGRHGAVPRCASYNITCYVIAGNDRMDDSTRQQLIPYLHRIADSRSDAHEAERLRVLVLGMTRVFVPRMLEQSGLYNQARSLRSIPNDATFEEMIKATKPIIARNLAVPAVIKDAAAWVIKAAKARMTGRTRMESLVATLEVIGKARMTKEGINWSDYFLVLDQVLSAGPQGEPWSADFVEHGQRLYAEAAGLEVA